MHILTRSWPPVNAVDKRAHVPKVNVQIGVDRTVSMMRRSCISKANQLPLWSEGGRWTCMPGDRGSDVHYISSGSSAFSFIDPNSTIDLQAALHWLRTSLHRTESAPSYQFDNLDGKVPQHALGGTLATPACALGFGGPRVAHHGQESCGEETDGSLRGKTLRFQSMHCFTVELGASMWSAE